MLFLAPPTSPDVSKTRGQSKLRKRKVNDSASSPKEKAVKILIEPDEKRKVKLTSHSVPPLPCEVVAKGEKDGKSVFDDIFGNGYDESSDHEET